MKSKDGMNKYFFSSVKQWPTGGLITKLYDKDDTIISSSKNLAHVCNAFYSKLYSRPTLDEQSNECCAELMSRVPCKF